MRRRGRPRYPDLLTPRQQAVFDLLRQGLTNEEIAQRLGISLDGAKYHVSDILMRLGVSNRYEAAEWQPQGERSGWPAFVAAPITFARGISLSATLKIGGGIVLSAAAIALAALIWGVVQTNGDTDTRVVAPDATPTPVTTGITVVDEAIRLLTAQDVEGLLDIVEFGDIGCSVEQTVGSPPLCEPGEPPGSPVGVFGLGFCEGAYATSIEQVHSAFEGLFADSSRSSVYAVLRDNSEDRGRDAYYVALTPGETTFPASFVSFWYVVADTGALASVQFECGPVGAAQQTEFRFPIDPDFVYGPQNNCEPPPGEYAKRLVRVAGLSPGGVEPQFWGSPDAIVGRPIVTVAPATRWYGDLSQLSDVRVGMSVQVVGRRQPDCTILAETIFIGDPPSTDCPCIPGFEGQILQDVDGNRDFSLDDIAARTLVQLVGTNQTFELYTGVDGGYSFQNVPDGEYTLRLWWSPGFDDVNATPDNAGPYEVRLTVDSTQDAPVSASGPLKVWVTPVAPDTLPFPSEEVAAPATIATGVLDIATATDPQP